MGVTRSSTATAQRGRDAFGQCITYGPTGMPDVMVLVDEPEGRVWRPGRVRMQMQLQDAGWVFSVGYFVGGRLKTDTFPAQRVRGEAVVRFIDRG